MGSRWRLPGPLGGRGRPVRCGYCRGRVYLPKARTARVRGVDTLVCGFHPVRPGER